MGALTYSKKIELAQVMVSGLKQFATDVAKRGLDAEFTTKLDEVTTSAVELNNQQETLKAELKTKTEELETLLAELDKQLSESKKVVKLSIPQSSWKAFGIESSR